MSDQHVQPPWYANGHAVYMGADGGFSLRCCPNQEANARHIVKAVNYHDRLREALERLVRSCDNLEYEAGRVALPASDAQDLLAELDNLEKQQ